MNEKKVRELVEDLRNVIVGAKELGGDVVNFKNFPVENLEVIAEALEKQLTMKPKASYNENIGRHQYHCPICDNLVLTEDITTALFGTDKKYCDNCGHRLTWRE